MGLVRTIAGAFVAAILRVSVAFGQTPQPVISVPQQYESLDQILAPIALYPDPLLAQILMAATYPLEVVEADRWVGEQENAALQGDRLTEALEEQRWDPSVKSLVPFAQILRMMDDQLEWTEHLGDAFLADQAAVMDAVQRLRQRAEAAGKLRSMPQEEVTSDGQAITIEPPDTGTVYIPVYDPWLAYGAWPYPFDPPNYFPAAFHDLTAGDLGFNWLGAPIVAPLWEWSRFNWGRHNIDIDPDRFATINVNHPPIGNGTWQHDPSHRYGVPYRDPTVRNRFAGSAQAPAPSQDLHGDAADAALQTNPEAQGVEPRHAVPPQDAPRAPPTFESFGRGPATGMRSERGHFSGVPVPRSAPGVSAPHFAPSSRSRERR
jgi:hypothetical protein